MSVFSDRLLLLRKENNLSQTSCAKKLQLSSRAYLYYEYGEREPRLSTLIKIADFYNVTLDYLAGRSDL